MFGVLRAPKEKLTKAVYQKKKMTYENHRRLMSMDDFLD